MLNEYYARFSNALTRINKSLQRIKDHGMQPYGLRGVHVLCLLYLSSGPQTVTRLAELSGLDKAAISRTVAELQRAGYAERGNPNGWRSTCVPFQLTEAGIRVMKEADKTVDTTVEEASRGLTDEERDAFLRALKLISDNLQALAERQCKEETT